MSSIPKPPKLEDLYNILEGKKIEEIQDRNLLVDFTRDVMYFRSFFTLQEEHKKAKYYSELHTQVCNQIRVLIANEKKTA